MFVLSLMNVVNGELLDVSHQNPLLCHERGADRCCWLSKQKTKKQKQET